MYKITMLVEDGSDLDLAMEALGESDLGGKVIESIAIEVVR